MSRFEPLQDVVEDLCLRSGDTLRRNKGLYLSCAKDTWNDLNETTLRLAKRLKMPVRKMFSINKRTNSIDMPCDFLKLSSVNVVDKCGIIYPVYRNLNVNNDIVDIPAEKNCACENNCGYKLCNTIKGYVAVQNVLSDVLPNGNPISFNCISRICVDKSGRVYQENQYPQRVYTNGVWTDTILYTSSTTICQCEVDSNGCVCDTPENINNVCSSCVSNFTSNINVCNTYPQGQLQPLVGGNNNGIPSFGQVGGQPSGTPVYNVPGQPYVGGTASCPPYTGGGECCSPYPNGVATCPGSGGPDEWIYYCNSKMDWFGVQCGCNPCGFRPGCANFYNIGDTGDRLVFPPNFGFDKVLVRYYADIELGDLQIPYIAKETFMKGLQYFAANNNEKKIQIADVFGKQYSRLKWGLFLELNKYRIAEMGNIVSPKAYVPSYIDHRSDRWYGYYY